VREHLMGLRKRLILVRGGRAGQLGARARLWAWCYRLGSWKITGAGDGGCGLVTVVRLLT
jgi:hypothetical protein